MRKIKLELDNGRDLTCGSINCGGTYDCVSDGCSCGDVSYANTCASCVNTCEAYCTSSFESCDVYTCSCP